MATMKVKNAAGEWVEVDSAISRNANLYMDRIEVEDNQFDLTKYVNCNHFLLFYTAASATAPTGEKYTKYVYDSHNTDGYAYIVDSKSTSFTHGIYELFDYTGKQNQDAVFLKAESVSGSFIVGRPTPGGELEKETMYFSHPGMNFGRYAIIVYAM